MVGRRAIVRAAVAAMVTAMLAATLVVAGSPSPAVADANDAPGAPAAFRQLSAGNDHTCAVLFDGRVKCWGSNEFGKLGLGDTANRGDAAGEMGDSLPAVDLGTGRTAVAISAGTRHTCAVLDDGSLKCWGHNAGGGLGLGDTANRGDAAGEMGDNLPAVDLGTGRTAVAVSVGQEYTCAVLDDGSVKCWGANSNGQAGHGDTVVRGNDPGEMGDALPAVALGTGRTAVAVAASTSFTCALLDDGSVKCWGAGGFGALGQGSTANLGDGPGELGDSLAPVNLGAGRTAVAITTGLTYTCALLDDGSVKCWGLSTDGGLGVGDTSVRGDGPGEMGDALPPVALGTGRTAHAVSAGSGHTCALLDDGSVKCWGWNIVGQLGLGDVANRGDGPGEMGDALPAAALGSGRTPVAVTAGGVHTCARLDDGSVKCWGFSDKGQLGLGDTARRGDGPGEMGDDLPAVQLVTPAPGLSVSVVAEAGPVVVGDTVDYEATVTNTGNVGLTGVSVSTPGSGGCATVDAVLSPGGSDVVACSHVATVDDVGTYPASASADSDQTGSVASVPADVDVVAPDGTGVVRGRVTAQVFGNAVAAVLVAALDPADASVVGLDTTDGDGQYAMLVPAGSVWLYRADPAQGHIPGFHSTTPTAVAAGQVLVMDTQLNRATGGIDGRITDAGSGDGVASGLALTTNAATGVVGIGATTDGSGYYAIEGLRSVSYLVTLLDLAGAHPPRFHDDAASSAGASPVHVVGDVLQAIDTTALPSQPAPSNARSLRGTVTGPGGAGLAGVAVVALNVGNYSFEAGDLTDASGHYQIGVDIGSFYLGFADPSGDHQFEWWPNLPGSHLEFANAVGTTFGDGLADETLTSNRGTISGTLTEDGSGDPLAGMWAIAIDSTGSVVAVDETAGDGSYTLADVPVGAVRVRFFDVSGEHVPEYYDDHGGASGSDGYAAATVIAVTGGVTSTIDASLALSS